MDEASDSHLVEELQQSISNLDKFVVLLNEHVWDVYEVSGWYDSSDNVHIIGLHVPQQKPGGAPPSTETGLYELHGENESWSMRVVKSEYFGDSGDTLRIAVNDYERYPHTFVEALQDDVDKRSTRYSQNNV